VYERFTERARKVMQLANREAQRFNHEYIGTEHILLGLVQEGSGAAANVLKNLDVDLGKVRLEVEKIVQPSPEDVVIMSRLPQTPRAKMVIEYSIEESRVLNHNYVGTEHLLLGLLREQEGVAAQILSNFGLSLEDVREETLNLLGGCLGREAALGRPVAVRPPPMTRGRELPAEEWPAEPGQALKELELQLETLNWDKEAAVAEQNFERAAHLRDQADKLKQRRRVLVVEWGRRHPPDPSWLSWHEGAVADMARAIGEKRRWEDLPVLADALEEAGCTDQEILNHCRRPGKHTYGCWVVALLLDQW
jgi:ATP-dependent Clp protease ATP-binding subunit ClpA